MIWEYRAFLRVAVALLPANCPALFAAQTTTPSAMPRVAGATFTMPSVWRRQQPSPALTVIEAPEGDLRIAIVEVGEAADARTAAATAWRMYRPAADRPVNAVSVRPGSNGWDEAHVFSYETSPAEHVDVHAYTRRYGRLWTVAIIEGNKATSEKRAAAIDLVSQSLRPAGFQRESFAGRVPHELNRARVSQVIDFVRTSAAKLGIPGVAFAIVSSDRIVFEGGIGTRALGTPEPVDERTKFMIASVTKSMTTLLLAKLVDEGRLRWDQPAIDVYPQFRLRDQELTRNVLVRHLVCACTGLPGSDLEMLFATTPSTPAARTFEVLAGIEPTMGLGEAYQYTNLLAAAGGYIAGSLTHPNLEIGEAYDRAMQEKIFDPLGMRDTTFSMAAGQTGNYASPHSRDLQGQVSVIGQDTNNAHVPFRPSGSAWSTAHDMALFVQNELNRGRRPDGTQLFSSANLTARWEPGVPNGTDSWYGMGLVHDIGFGVPVIYHTGDVSGYHSGMYIFPEAQIGVVILTNSDDGHRLRWPFMRRLLEILYDGNPEAVADIAARGRRLVEQANGLRSKLINPPPADALSELASKYNNPDLGQLIVSRNGQAARFRAQAWTSNVALRRNDDNTLSFVTISPGLLGWYDFVVGRDSSGRGTLTTHEGDRVYVFTEARPS